MKRRDSGSVLVSVVVVLAIASAAFFYNQRRSVNLVKDINKTINSFAVDAKLLEIRSLLTNVEICESSLKGLSFSQPSVFTLKNNGSAININLAGDELKLKSLKLIPLITAAKEISSANIEVTLEYKTGTEQFTKVFPLTYNFISNGTVKECLGEKSEESDELYEVTIAQKRKEICTDALKGTIVNGKCEWPW